MRHETTSDIEAIQLDQIIIRLDRGKLKYLIEGCLRSGRFSIVEYKRHSGVQTLMWRCAPPRYVTLGSTI